MKDLLPEGQRESGFVKCEKWVEYSCKTSPFVLYDCHDCCYAHNENVTSRVLALKMQHALGIPLSEHCPRYGAGDRTSSLL